MTAVGVRLVLAAGYTSTIDANVLDELARERFVAAKH
jgi:hypothetical protein